MIAHIHDAADFAWLAVYGMVGLAAGFGFFKLGQRSRDKRD